MGSQDHELRRALRDLFGWRVGMGLKTHLPRSEGGTVVLVQSDGLWVVDEQLDQYWWSLSSTDGLPALDSSANRGTWLAWAADNLPGLRAEQDDGAAFWRIQCEEVESAGPFEEALLRTICAWADAREWQVPFDVPDAVAGWWDKQKKAEARKSRPAPDWRINCFNIGTPEEEFVATGPTSATSRKIMAGFKTFEEAIAYSWKRHDAWRGEGADTP